MNSQRLQLINFIKIMLILSSMVFNNANALEESHHLSIQYLAHVMDQFHDRIPVYDDVSSAGNRFSTYGKLPNESAPVSLNGSWPESSESNPTRLGSTVIRNEFVASSPTSYGGFYFLNGVLKNKATTPSLNFGEIPNAGIDLSGTIKLTFWARGERGNEIVEFFMGGVGRKADTGAPETPFPGSSKRSPDQGTYYILSTKWQQFTIDLTGLDLSYVLGGFAWVANSINNPNGAIFYLDDIQYELSPDTLAARLNEPRFLASYTTLPIQPKPSDCQTNAGIDLALRNMAFSYDNSLALIAFLADGSSDSLRRARLIGDAFVYASNHDRYFNDGRIRSGYTAGDIVLPAGWTPNNRFGSVSIPGFFCADPQIFFETEQSAIDVGNNAWTMIALLALHKATNEISYLNTARRIGLFINSFKNTSTDLFQGFQGGINDPETVNPSLRIWASAEHNLDVYAAFSVMSEITGEKLWSDGAQHAQSFIEALWDSDRGCYAAGTLSPDKINMNNNQLSLDVEAWAMLALPDILSIHPNLLTCPETYHQTSSAGFKGFDFNDDKDGIWFEGTAQMATAYAFANNTVSASIFRAELMKAQVTPPFGNGTGIVAASKDQLSTGFKLVSGEDFLYYRRLHIAVAAWNVFAQLELNPYYQVIATVVPDIKANGSDTSITINQGDMLTVTASLSPNSRDGKDADWWVAAISPFGISWYTLDRGWVISDLPLRAYAGSLFNLPSYSLLKMSSLPAGEYTLYFGVDDNMDNALDATYLDSVLVSA